MNSKILLLSIAVVAIGLFALPSTMSLFSGQHTFYSGENVSCAKCHSDVAQELTLSQAHTGASFKTIGGQNCARCHTTSEGWNETGMNMSYGQWRAYPYKGTTLTGAVNVTAHAAVTVECLACHGTSAANWNASKGISRVAAEIQGSAEAHRGFYYGAISNKTVGDINESSLRAAGIVSASVPSWYGTGNPTQNVIQLKGSNTACIGCHTHAIVNITWKRSEGYGLDIDTTSGTMAISNWNINQSTTTTFTSGE